MSAANENLVNDSELVFSVVNVVNVVCRKSELK